VAVKSDKPRIQFRLRIGKGELWAIGPGKVALLEAIAEAGSISGAARNLGMSYRRAWNLTDEINRGLASPAVQAMPGGVSGGGASLTPVGRKVIELYRGIERDARRDQDAAISALTRLLA
jgi:molybdate transport system regulatory protein